MSDLKEISRNRCFGGWQKRFEHRSEVLDCNMHVSIYYPPQYNELGDGLPVLYWLSGLTCTDENFVTKAGAQRTAAELGMILVMPDTSPRGDDVADDPDGAYDLGLGAGFYLNATQPPWNKHYRMYDYVVDELPALVNNLCRTNGRASISGHSMGGHGALVIGLSNMQQYQSISAFAPIVNPMDCPWGQKALSAYLGDNTADWQDYDACHLLRQQGQFLSRPILIDQGLDDNFLDSQKLTRPFEEVATEVGYPAQVHYHPDYDHSYFFIASFIDAHLRFHARHLKNQ